MSYNATTDATQAYHIKDLREGLDIMWILVCAVLVLLMQAGFSMLEAGSVRANNTKSLVLKNFADLVIGSLFYGIAGYFLAFGTYTEADGLVWSNVGEDDAFFFFQLAFACTAATIDSGSVAERIDMNSYLLLSGAVCLFIYPIPCNWVWNNGFLADMGFQDFAGGSVVHGLGGICGLVGSIMLGPRIGRFTPTGEVKDIPGHSIVLQALGTWLLFVGWFGFNCGSTLQLTDGNSADAAHVANTTILAGLMAGLFGLVAYKNIFGRYNVSAGFNSLLMGLVVVTPGAPYVSLGASMVLGGIAGILYCFISNMMLHRFGIDDPLDAFTVHGVGGMTGTLLIGLFDRDKGLFYGGGFHLLGVQTAGVCIISIWAAVTMFICHWVVHKARGTTRVSRETEMAGCDSELLGGPAYHVISQQSAKESETHLLEDLLIDHATSRIFRDFLQRKDSEEMINFFYHVMDFQALYRMNKTENKSKSDQIFSTYVQEGAPCRVNLPGWVYKDLLIRRNFPTETMYHDALDEVVTSLRELCDAYFPGSEEFKRYVTYKESLLPKPLLHSLSKCCCFGKSAEAKMEENRNKAIENDLQRAQFEQIWTGTVLLLGAGESGKSTFLKQIRQQYDSGADTAAFQRTITAIRTNVVECVQTLLLQEQKMSDENFEGLNTLPVIDPIARNNILAMIARAGNYSKQDAEVMKAVWEHPRIKHIYEHRSQFWLIEACAYYLDNIDRLLDQPGHPYSPTEQDVLYARVKTVGIQEVQVMERTLNNLQKVLSYPHGAVSGFRTFQEVIKHNDFPAVKKMEECMDAFVRADVGSMSWKIIDVGGQRSERRKWAAYLDNVDLVFFMLNANGYKSPLYEDNSLRKSDESIALFENTFKTSFLNHPIYVMLTKTDLFHEEFDAKMFASAYPGWLPPVEVNDTKSLAEATDKSMSVSKNALQYLEVYVRSKCPKVSRVSVASVSMFDQNRLFDVFQECKDEVIYGRYDKMWEYLDAHQQDRNLRMTARRGKKGAAGKYKVAPGPAGGHASGAEGSQTRSALRSGTMSPSSKSGALISGYEECGVGFVNKNYLAAALRKRG